MADRTADLAALLTAIVQSSDDAIVSKDLDGIVMSWNSAAERMFGYSACEMVGRSIRAIIPADRQHEEDEVLSRIRRGDSVDHFETTRRRKDGTLIPISLTVSPLRLASGEIVGASKIARDISQRRLAEAQTEHARQQLNFLAQIGATLAETLQYEQTLKTIAELAVPYLADWCTVDLVRDDKFERLAISHRDPAKVELGWALERRWPVHERTADGPAEVIRTGRPLLRHEISGEVLAALTDDPGHLALLQSIGITSAMILPLTSRGRIFGAISFAMDSNRRYSESDLGFAADVAARAAMAIENARAYEELRVAGQMKDEFLATLSHELRTPLNAIVGYTHMLREGKIHGEKAERALDTVQRNAKALAQIVEDVLDISRIVSGKIRLNVQPTHIAAVLNDAVATVLPGAEAKGVRLHLLLDPRVRPVSGDPDRLQQVIWNLLSNAVKFTPRGGAIHVRVEQDDEAVAITVTDTGVGIGPEFLPHIFERFRQADSSITRAYTGLGLGLAITRHIVEAHGGTVHVSSEGLGKGATFRVRLPMSPAPHAVYTAPRVWLSPLPRAAEPGAKNLAGTKVLAVDDDPDALMLVRDILESAGAEVTTANSAAASIEALQTFRPDVLVADVGMPTVDGFELIKQIRTSPDESLRTIPAAALTAYARSDDRIKAIRSGFEMHLAKPIHAEELVDAVEALARKRDALT